MFVNKASDYTPDAWNTDTHTFVLRCAALGNIRRIKHICIRSGRRVKFLFIQISFCD